MKSSNGSYQRKESTVFSLNNSRRQTRRDRLRYVWMTPVTPYAKETRRKATRRVYAYDIPPCNFPHSLSNNTVIAGAAAKKHQNRTRLRPYVVRIEPHQPAKTSNWSDPSMWLFRPDFRGFGTNLVQSDLPHYFSFEFWIREGWTNYRFAIASY